MAPAPPLLRVRELSATFEDPSVRVLDGVSFDVQAGSALAIVGDSGSGKSLIGKAIVRLLPQAAQLASGSIRLEGRELLTLSETEMRAVRGRRVAMIFQEPSRALSPVHTIGWQLKMALAAGEDWRSRASGLRTRGARALELAQRVDLPDPRGVLRAYPRQLSAGMRQRVVIAMALARNPRVIVADEPTTGLDGPVQGQIVDLFRRVLAGGDRAAIFITHDLGAVAEVATHVAILHGGRIVEMAPVENLLAEPQHPYSRALLASVPRLERGIEERRRQGSNWKPSALSMLPEAVDESPANGCHFAPACPLRLSNPAKFPRCLSDRPELVPPGARHRARCFYPNLSTGTE